MAIPTRTTDPAPDRQADRHARVDLAIDTGSDARAEPRRLRLPPTRRPPPSRPDADAADPAATVTAAEDGGVTVVPVAPALLPRAQPGRHDRPGRGFGYLVLFSEIGFSLLVTTLIGVLVGYQIDSDLGILPVFLIVGFLVARGRRH